jgi:hypothetical protein
MTVKRHAGFLHYKAQRKGKGRGAALFGGASLLTAGLGCVFILALLLSYRANLFKSEAEPFVEILVFKPNEVR